MSSDTIFFMPVCGKYRYLSQDTAESLRIHEPNVPLVFCAEDYPSFNNLLQYGEVKVGTPGGWGRTWLRMVKHYREVLDERPEVKYLIKIDPDAYCLRSGGVAAIKSALDTNPVVGAINYEWPGGLGLGCVVGLTRSHVEDLIDYPVTRLSEDLTRDKFMREHGIKTLEIPEITVEPWGNYTITEETAFVAPYKVAERQYRAHKRYSRV